METLNVSESQDARIRNMILDLRRGDTSSFNKTIEELDKMYHYAGIAPSHEGFFHLLALIQRLFTRYIHDPHRKPIYVVLCGEKYDPNDPEGLLVGKESSAPEASPGM